MSRKNELVQSLSSTRVELQGAAATRTSGNRLPPTVEAYAPLQIAYDHFNMTLFKPWLSVTLPDCLITLQRDEQRVLGYFYGDRFGRMDCSGVTVDEIAMNPRHFLTRTIKETLSTLVHEMVHLWQHHFGEPSRTGYHNREWADAMKVLGLRPTHNGTPDGRVTGQRMTHLILTGGPFDIAADQLFEGPFRICWYDRLAEMSPAVASSSNGDNPNSPGRPGQRAKFSCRQCRANAWGKPTLHLICGSCRQDMTRT